MTIRHCKAFPPFVMVETVPMSFLSTKFWQLCIGGDITIPVINFFTMAFKCKYNLKKKAYFPLIVENGWLKWTMSSKAHSDGILSSSTPVSYSLIEA